MMAGVEPTMAPSGCDRMKSMSVAATALLETFRYALSVAAFADVNAIIVPFGSAV